MSEQQQLPIETLQRYLPDGLTATGQYAFVPITAFSGLDKREHDMKEAAMRVAAVIDGAVTIIAGQVSDFTDLITEELPPNVDLLVVGVGRQDAA